MHKQLDGRLVIIKIIVTLIIGTLCIVIFGEGSYKPVYCSRFRNWAQGYSDKISVIYEDGHYAELKLGKAWENINNNMTAVRCATVLNKLGFVKSTAPMQESKDFADYILSHEDIFKKQVEFTSNSVGQDMGSTSNCVIYKGKCYNIYSYGDWVSTPDDVEYINAVKELYSIIGVEIYIPYEEENILDEVG